jgi:SNF2 family DNA or RNA helicase
VQASLPFTPARTFGAVSIHEGEFHLSVEPHVAMRLKRVFPKLPSSAHGVIRLQCTEENARELLWFMDRFPLEWDPPRQRYKATDMAYRFEQRQVQTQRILDGNYQSPDVSMALPPRQYQVESAMLGWTNGGILVGDELGLGKTVSGITMLSKADALPAVVVVPPHLQTQWERELHRFLPDASTHIVKRTDPYELPNPDVLIITYHKLHAWVNVLRGWAHSVVFDEAQELRRRQNDRWGAAYGIAETACFRMGLTATPIYNYGSEFYNVLECIRPGALGARSEFLREWCTDEDNRGRASIRDPRAFGSYLREMGLFIRRTRSSVGRELPDLMTLVETVEADTGYLDREKDSATTLAKIILGDGQGFEKFRAGGELDYRLRQATGIAKAPYVSAFVDMLLSETEEPVILVGWHRAVYDLWLRQLRRYSPVLYTGTESPSAKEKAKNAFLNGESNLLILSLRSGTGLDGLQERCHRIVFGELDWSPAVHEQCIGRIHRDGQPEPTFAYYLVADEGSDPVIRDALGIKRGQSVPVLDPDTPVIEQRRVDPEHIKRLAESYLRRQG